MAFFDKLKEVGETVAEKAKDAGSSAVEKSKDAVEIQKLKSQISKSETEMNGIFAEVGKALMEKYPDVAKQYFGDKVEAVSGLMEKIEGLKASIANVKAPAEAVEVVKEAAEEIKDTAE